MRYSDRNHRDPKHTHNQQILTMEYLITGLTAWASTEHAKRRTCHLSALSLLVSPLWLYPHPNLHSYTVTCLKTVRLVRMEALAGKLARSGLLDSNIEATRFTRLRDICFLAFIVCRFDGTENRLFFVCSFLLAESRAHTDA